MLGAYAISSSRMCGPGLCIGVLLTCLTVGSPLAGQRVQRCEKWCLCASFSVCGGKRMIETLSIGRGRGGYFIFVL
jgi:hypothetical protein